MALWFALDRFESFRDYVDGAADILILNRYVLSNAVYQSIRDVDLGKPDIADWVFDVEYNHLGLPRPDVNLVFLHRARRGGGKRLQEGLPGLCRHGARRIRVLPQTSKRAGNAAIPSPYAARYDDIAVIPCMEEGRLLPVEAIGAAVLAALRVRRIIA